VGSGVFVMSVLALLIGTTRAETTVAVSELTVDGLRVLNLDCSLENTGLLAAANVVSALAQQDHAFDACFPEGTAFSVQWTWGAVSNASVLSSDHPEANDCIQAALAQTTFSLNGQCTAVILVGDEEAAAAAAATLLSATAP